MRFAAGCTLVAVLSLGMVACGDETDPTPPGPATIRIVNSSGAPILSVFSADCNILVWGSDELAVGETIADGAEKSFAVTEGCWDLRVDFIEDATPSERGPELLNNQIDENETFTWTVPVQP